MPKGVCEIILEENGKEVLHTKDENMVTNAITNLLNPPANMFYSGGINYSSVISKKTPIATKLLSGVMLFASQITENPNTIYPPADNSQVGCAGNDAYSGTNTMRGSYSSPESGAVANGYKHVWNFSEPQSNGTIRCVSLTSPQGGKGGWNCPNDAQNSFMANYAADLAGSESAVTTINYIDGILGNYSKDVFTIVKSISGKTVTFSDYALPTSVKLNDDLFTPTSLDTVKTSNLNLNPYPISWFASEDFCSSAYNESPSNTFSYVKFKGTDKSILSEQTITVSGATFNLSGLSSWFGEKDGYLYMLDYASQNKVWKINLANLADVTSVTLPESITYPMVFKVPTGIVFLNTNSRNGYCINGSSYSILGFANIGVSSFQKIIPSSFIPAPYVIVGIRYASTSTVYIPCLSIIAPYLATIDNLASPVTKTANQTMKVIYTITNT